MRVGEIVTLCNSEEPQFVIRELFGMQARIQCIGSAAACVMSADMMFVMKSRLQSIDPPEFLIEGACRAAPIARHTDEHASFEAALRAAMKSG